MSISSTIRAGAAYVEVTAETSKLQRNLTSAQAQLQNFVRTCTTVGKDLLMLSGAMSLPLVLAAKSFAGFDDSMRLVQAVTQATNDDFKALTKTAQRLGRDTSYTAQQAADAMVSLGRMGFNPREIQASIDAVLNLARSTGTDLAEAGDIAANSMRIFGIEASQMSDVADVLTVTANSSAQTLTDLFEALKMGGPQAAAAGESIRETSAAIAVLANMGIKGSLAGTALRKSFSQFAKTKVQEQLRSVGVETLDANGNLRKMAVIMRDIAKVMNTMPSAEKLAFAEDIFDIRGSLAGLTLTANTDELDAMLAKLENVEGVAAKTATAMDAGLGGSFRLLESAVEGSLNAIADAMNSTLQPMIQKITAVINAITVWIEKNQGLVTAFAVTVAGAAGLGIALVTVGIAAKGVAAGIAVVQGAITAFNFVQGMCIAQIGSLKTSFTLLTQAFADYRNLAIPAMVGTEKFCAALGLASTSANRTAASIILMSNAEAAATAKTALAAKWAAVIAALRKFSLASIAATAASKAQMVAEAACAIGTKVLAGARTFAATATTLFSGSTVKATLSAVAGSAANVALAITAKAVAGAYTLATAAAAAFCAIPITWIFLALAGALVGVVAWLTKAANYTAKLSDESEKLREKNDELRKGDEIRMERLKQLSEKEKLNNDEMKEASKLAEQLQGRYGNLGVSIDTVAGKLNLAADAQDKFNAAMKRAALADLDAEIREIQNNIAELRKESNAQLSRWNYTPFAIMMGWDDDAVAKIEENGNKILALQDRLFAARTRRDAIANGDKDAVTGKTEDTQTTQTKVEEEKQRRITSKQTADDAAKRAADIEKQLTRERQTELQNEIDDIIALRDEYKQLIQTMLDYEKSKPEDQQNKQKISELEGKLVQADVTAQERIAKAKERAAEAAKREVENYRRNFAESAQDIQKRRDMDAQDRKVDETLKSDKDAGVQLLQQLIAQYQKAAADAKAQFERELAEAQADGKIDDAEKRRIDAAQDAYLSSESLVDKYSGKLREAQSGTQQAIERTNSKSVGAWSAQELDALLGGGGNAQERTAKATEEIAANTKENNKLIRRLKGGSSAALTFS